MRRVFVLVVVMALVLSACGGSSGDGGDNEPDQPGATDQVPDDDGTPPANDGGESDDTSGGEGPSTATVTIGGETYEFSSENAVVAQCLPDLFGIMSVQLPMADGGDGFVSIVALHEGTDPAVVEEINAIEVTIGDVDWVANAENVNIAGNPDVEGQSQVDSLEVDGNTVRGTASFAGSETVFSADFVEFATGTFEATCGEERTS